MSTNVFPAVGQTWGRRSLGLAIVALLHLAIVAMLVNTLARRSTIISPTLVETTIVSEPLPQPVAASRPEPVARPPSPQPPPVKAEPAPKPLAPRPVIRRPEFTPATPPPASPQTVLTAPPPLPAPVEVAPHLDSRASREPQYPPLSRQFGEQGSVVLQVLVGSDGRVLDTKLIQSSGFARLDQAALAEIERGYRFVPGAVDGKPQPMWLTIKYNWQLR